MHQIEMLESIMRSLWGDRLDDDSMRDTPSRVLKYWQSMAQSNSVDDAIAHLQKTFTSNHDQLVLVKDIEFYSLCEHHLLPVIGRCHVAYIPNGMVVGLSKIPRAINVLAARPQLQERLTDQIADALVGAIAPLGVAVVIEAVHTCMTGRGVSKFRSTTITSKVTGVFRDDANARAEVMGLLK